MAIDFNSASEQGSFDLIPDGAIVPVIMTIKAGGAGEGGWLTRSKDGGSESISAQFAVLEGSHKGSRFFQYLLVDGTTDGHRKASEITRTRLRAILESARGVKPSDMSERAMQARRLTGGWAELDGICFVVVVGIEPASGNYKAKNIIKAVVTPESTQWCQLEQRLHTAAPSAAPAQVAALPPINKPAWA